MRKLAIYFGAALLVVAVLAISLAGCGSQGAAQAGPTDPPGILNQALTAATPITNGTGQFDLSVAVNGDPTKLPAEAKALLSQPISLTGTVSASGKPMAVDVQMTASIAGQNLPLGLKMTGGKAWIQFAGTWYEAPAELMNAMSTATTAQQATGDSLLQAFKAAGIDVSTWITGLTLVGEDDLGGTKAYHLSGNLDINKIIMDGLKLMQDKNLQNAIPGMGALGGGTGTSLTMPTGTELQDIQKQLAAIFQTLKVDIWITKDGYQLRQAAIDAKIVPPAGEDAAGINDITLKINASMAPSDAPVTVTPPTDAKPFSELEKALGALSSMFSGMLGGGQSGTTTTAPAAQ